MNSCEDSCILPNSLPQSLVELFGSFFAGLQVMKFCNLKNLSGKSPAPLSTAVQCPALLHNAPFKIDGPGEMSWQEAGTPHSASENTGCMSKGS